jgi:hypothetical protein
MQFHWTGGAFSFSIPIPEVKHCNRPYDTGRFNIHSSCAIKVDEYLCI